MKKNAKRLYMLLVYGFFYIPLLVVFVYSFNRNYFFSSFNVVKI